MHGLLMHSSANQIIFTTFGKVTQICTHDTKDPVSQKFINPHAVTPERWAQNFGNG